MIGRFLGLVLSAVCPADDLQVRAAERAGLAHTAFEDGFERALNDFDADNETFEPLAVPESSVGFYDCPCGGELEVFAGEDGSRRDAWIAAHRGCSFGSAAAQPGAIQDMGANAAAASEMFPQHTKSFAASGAAVGPDPTNSPVGSGHSRHPFDSSSTPTPAAVVAGPVDSGPGVGHPKQLRRSPMPDATATPVPPLTEVEIKAIREVLAVADEARQAVGSALDLISQGLGLGDGLFGDVDDGGTKAVPD